MQSEKSADMRCEINEKKRRYGRACEQIALLDRKIAELEKRYKRAKRDKMRPFRYNIRLRLQVLHGVRNMYSNYAGNKAAELRSDLMAVLLQMIPGLDSDN
jgi:ribosomal protein S15P/S13E